VVIAIRVRHPAYHSRLQPPNPAAHPARRLHVQQARRTASRCPRRPCRRANERRRVGCSGRVRCQPSGPLRGIPARMPGEWALLPSEAL